MAINIAANKATPFQPRVSPAAAKTTSVSHSIVMMGLAGRVWEKTSV